MSLTSELLLLDTRPWGLIWTLIAAAAVLAVLGFVLMRRS
ncbi:hypothetical protein BJ980_002294 [Nocardioides daedukensis]|uniref:Uncharacterized protein n=1 Tax=Nocardioides daedukensis TaxID=634462 RepID=A0A7Y9S1C1_9ACTN|nr:hypothetical protein [Nocardioides daedukensis]